MIGCNTLHLGPVAITLISVTLSKTHLAVFVDFKENYMAYAIIRIEKIKTRQGITQREKHNERTKDTPNADEKRRGLNQEYVNLAGHPVLKLVDDRMQEMGVDKPRSNATLCVEVLMTGGSEAAVWQRAPATGEAADMRESQWAADVVAFAKAEWGKNLVSLLLHQDEKTPHFQAFVVPICVGEGKDDKLDPQAATAVSPHFTQEKGRLSARDLFSPATLAQLQTDFANAVAAHGFERGIAGSRAHHKTMREMYGLQEKTVAEIALLVEPASVQKFELEKPPVIFNKEDWRTKTEAKINEEIARQVGEANSKLAVAGQAAVVAAGGNEASDRSRNWVAAEKERGEKSAEKLVASEAALAEMTKKLACLEAKNTQYAVWAAGGVIPRELIERGTWERQLILGMEAQIAVDDVLKAGRLDSRADFFAQLTTNGYRWENTPNSTPEEGHFHQKKPPYTWFTPTELPQGRGEASF